MHIYDVHFFIQHNMSKTQVTKILTIPEDISDIASFRIYSKALKEFKILEDKAKDAAKKIVRTHFMFTPEEIVEKLSSKDFENFMKKSNVLLDEDEDFVEDNSYMYWVLDFQKKTMEPVRCTRIIRGWIMGAISGTEVKYKFEDENTILAEFSWSTQEARFSHVPWIHHTHVERFNISKL